MDIKGLIGDIRGIVKSDILSKLEEDIKDTGGENLLSKRDEIKDKLDNLNLYLDKEIENLISSFNTFNSTFKIDKLKEDVDIMLAFSTFTDFENTLLSSYMRNNKYYNDYQKLKKLIIKLLSKLYSQDSVVTKVKLKELKPLIENDEVYELSADLEETFKTFFKNYENVADKMKQRGYTLKTYIEFLKFSRGND